jgi:NADH-quinone oxidoreductase subunit K
MVSLEHYLMLSAILFATGTIGVNLAFIAFGRAHGEMDGQVIMFFVVTVAAAEAAVGLALVIALFRHRETLNPDVFTSLKW